MTLSAEAQALLNRMTPEEQRETANHVIDEYNANYEQGGEMDYPMWADQVLAAIEQAEQLAKQVTEFQHREPT